MPLREEYLQLADEAENKLKLVKDPQARDSWERIVVGYLELAEMAGSPADRKNWLGHPR